MFFPYDPFTSGELGLGDNINRNTPTQLGTDSDWAQVASGDGHSLGIKTAGSAQPPVGTLWGWGSNKYGQLGLGDDGSGTNRNTPTQIGTDSNWAQVATGYWYTLGCKTGGTLWGWGCNQYGQSCLCEARRQVGLGDNTHRNTPSQIGTDSDWNEVAGGGFANGGHGLGLKTTGILWAWGNNGYGQLGLGDRTNRNTPTQLGTDSDWTNIASGSDHNICRKTDSTIWSWGYNDSGQLGLGDSGSSTNRKIPTQIGTDSDWTQITTARNYTLGLKTNRTLWAWGQNDMGQLGLGDMIERNAPRLVEE